MIFVVFSKNNYGLVHYNSLVHYRMAAAVSEEHTHLHRERDSNRDRNHSSDLSLRQHRERFLLPFPLFPLLLLLILNRVDMLFFSVAVVGVPRSFVDLSELIFNLVWRDDDKTMERSKKESRRFRTKGWSESSWDSKEDGYLPGSQGGDGDCFKTTVVGSS